MTGRALTLLIRHRPQLRIVIVVLLSLLGVTSALYLSGGVVARAQTVSGVAGTPTSTPFPTHVLTPPPSPCAAEPSGSCPSCTSDVPGASEYENSLPVPTPLDGYHYVVQLVNESNVTILAGVDAAHQGSLTPNGPVPPPIAVMPREGTWVMQPKGSADFGNVLTIDVPQGWEATVCPQDNTNCNALGPRFWPRTGCKYSVEYNFAQCETGGCGDAYDCGQQALKMPPQASVAPPPTSIVEWTFNSQAAQGYQYPDISLVDGVTLTIDVQALGLHCASKPGDPTNMFWLSQRQPLGIHGADLREAGRCIPNFRLTRQEVGQIIQGEGNPDDVVACFTNCGRYEYPINPGANCNPEDERCRNWLAFCCYTPSGDPNHVYGGDCAESSECRQGGGCWNNGSQPCSTTPDCQSGFSCVDGVCAMPFCACRAFNKQPTCPADVCTHPYTPTDRSSQPPFGLCSDVTGDPSECIGDDTVHAVFPGGYTWPNDPQTYVSDARAYRIIFAPGYTPGVNPPITDSGPIPACDSLPEAYGYESQAQNCSGVAGKQFAGAFLSPTCNPNDNHCPDIPGITPPQRFVCDPATKYCDSWSCEIAPGGPVTTGKILCSWATSGPSPSPTPTMQLGGQPTTAIPTATRKPGSSDDSCAIDPNAHDAHGGMILAIGLAAGLLRLRRRFR